MIARLIMFAAIAALLWLTVTLDTPIKLAVSACIIALWGGAYWTGLRHAKEMS